MRPFRKPPGGNDGSGGGSGFPYNGLENAAWPQLIQDQAKLAKGGSIGTNGVGAVAWRFDHARDFSKVFPLLQARGMPASLAHCSDMHAQTAGTTTWSDIRTWNRNGVEIWSHSHTHNDPNPGGYAQLVQEIVGSKEIIEGQNVHVVGWVMPGTTQVGDTIPYGVAFNTLEAFNSDAGRLFVKHYPFSEHYVTGVHRTLPNPLTHGLDHITIDAMTVASFKAAIDHLVIARQFGIEFMQHPWLLDAAGFITTAQLAEMLDYVLEKWNAGDLEVLSPSGLMVADAGHNNRLNLVGKKNFSAPHWQLGLAAGHTIEAGAGVFSDTFLRIPDGNAGFTNVDYTNSGPLRLGVVGHAFLLEGWARRTSGTPSARVIIRDAADAAILNIDRNHATNTDGSWTRLRIPFSIPPNMGNLRLRFARGGSGGVDFDEISVKAV